MGVSEARGARGLARYLRDQHIRVSQTDSFEGDTRVHRNDSTEENIAQGKDKKRSFWHKKKYWILAISVISLLFFALTLSLSLYFGLYYGNHATKGDYSKVLKVKKFSFIYVYAYKQF